MKTICRTFQKEASSTRGQTIRGNRSVTIGCSSKMMPRMSGRELAEQLAIERPGTCGLYMSGFTDDAIVRHGLLEEDIAFIQKPFTPESLATKIRELLDEGQVNSRLT